jgi:hypothetical protein
MPRICHKERTNLMNFEAAKGPPMVAAFIVLLAIVLLGSISFAFQGSVQF